MPLTPHPVRGTPAQGRIPVVDQNDHLRYRRMPTYHIADWGAVAGDGVTFDHTAIQAALIAARNDAASEFEVEFDPVTYRLGGGITIPEGGHVKGVSMGGSGTEFIMDNSAPSAAHLFSPDDVDNSRMWIEGVRLMDERTDAGRTGWAIYANRVVNGAVFKDIRIYNFYGGVFAGSDVTGHTGDVIYLENVWVDRCLQDQVNFTRCDNNVVMLFCHLHPKTGSRAGVYIDSTNTAVIEIIGTKVEGDTGNTAPIIYANSSNGSVQIHGLADRNQGTHDTIYCSASSAPQRVVGFGIYRRTAGVLFNDAVLSETYSVSAGTHTPWVGSRAMHLGHAVYGSLLSSSSDYGTVTIRPRATDKRGLTIQGLSGQSVDHLRVMNDANTTLFRIASDGKAVAHQGIGVGNSVAATTLGTVTKKIQVYDASGASLGYVPVYDAIT